MLILSFSFPLFAVPLTDHVMFAFEKCKSLSYDLKKGELKEASQLAPFDLHCKKRAQDEFVLDCSYFQLESNAVSHKEVFQGESQLGEAVLKSSDGVQIKFFIGKKFAAYIDPKKLQVCMGIYVFEKDALKKKN